MADIIDFRTRSIQHDTNPPHPSVPREDLGLIITCHCSSTAFEIRNGGVIFCARCQCQQPMNWSWMKETPA